MAAHTDESLNLFAVLFLQPKENHKSVLHLGAELTTDSP